MAHQAPKAEFGPHARSPHEAPPRPAHNISSPWRHTFESFLASSVPPSRMPGLQAQVGAIEAASGGNGAAVVSLLEKTFTEKVSPLGEAAACAFVGAVLTVSLRVAAQGKSSEDAAGQICGATEKLGRIAELLKDGKAFAGVCSASGVMPDFPSLFKYINYMLAASQVLKDAGMVSVQAAFISEKTRGMASGGISMLLTRMLERLNEIVAKAEAEKAKGGAGPATP